jgi:sortase A
VNRVKSNKGKHLNKNNKGNKTVRIIIILIIMIITLIIILKFTKQDNNVDAIPQENISKNVIESEPLVEPSPTPKVNDEVVSVDDMPNKMGIYHVVGEIVIDKINVKKYILDRTTINSLDLAVTKFEGTEVGPEINTVGNFMIMGHNYSKIFKRLKELNIGDEFYLIGKDGRKVTYVIYDKYSMDPQSDEEEAKLISQQTNGKRIVTLITCNPGAITRLILKAEEKIGGI